MSESLPTLITASKSLSDFRAESSEIELSGSFKNAYQMQCSVCNSFMPKFFEHCIVCGHTIMETSHLPLIDYQEVYDTYRESMKMRNSSRQKNLSKLKRKVKKDKKLTASSQPTIAAKQRERLEKLSLPNETIAAIQAVDIHDEECRQKKIKILKSIMLKANSLEMKNAKMIEEIMQRTIKLKEHRHKVRQHNIKGYLDEIESIQNLYSQAKQKITQTRDHTIHLQRPVSPSYLNDRREESEGDKETKAWLWTNLLVRPLSRGDDERPQNKHSQHHHNNKHHKHNKYEHDKVPMFWGHVLHDSNNNNDDDEENDKIVNNQANEADTTNPANNDSTFLPSITEDDEKEHDIDRFYNLMRTTTTNLTFHTDDGLFISQASTTRTHNLDIDSDVLQQMAVELVSLEHEINHSRVPMTIDGFKTDQLENDTNLPPHLLFPIVDSLQTQETDLHSQNIEFPSQVELIKQLRRKAHYLLQTLTSNPDMLVNEDEEIRQEQILCLQAQIEHYDYFMLQSISWQLHNLELAEMVRERKALDTAASSTINIKVVLPPIEGSKKSPTEEKKKRKGGGKSEKETSSKHKHADSAKEEDIASHTFKASFTDFATTTLAENTKIKNRPPTILQPNETTEFSHLQTRHLHDEKDDVYLDQLASHLEEIIESKRLFSIEREMDMHEIETELNIPTLEGQDLIPKVTHLFPHESHLLTHATQATEPLKVDLLSEYDKLPKLSLNDEETENTNILFVQAEDTETRSELRLQALLEVESSAYFHSAYEQLTLHNSSDAEVNQRSEADNDDEGVDMSLTRNQLPSHKTRFNFDNNLKLSRLYQRSIRRMRAILPSLEVDLRQANTDFALQNRELPAAIVEAKDAIDCAHEVHSLVKELLQKFHRETSTQRLTIAQEISEAMRHVARIERSFQRKLATTQNGSKPGATNAGSVVAANVNKAGEAQEVISIHGEKITRLQQQEADLIEAIRQQELSMQEAIDLWRPKHSQVLNECTIAMIRAQGFVFAFHT